jgi:hypothetical protein
VLPNIPKRGIGIREEPGIALGIPRKIADWIIAIDLTM